MHESGVRIPGDIAFIGFDGIYEASTRSRAAGRRQIAELGVSTLLERVMGAADANEPRMIAPEFNVVEREATCA